MKEGKIEGMKEGKIEGIKEGKKENSLYIARKLIKKGLDKKEIAEITNLSIEEINELK